VDIRIWVALFLQARERLAETFPVLWVRGANGLEVRGDLPGDVQDSGPAGDVGPWNAAREHLGEPGVPSQHVAPPPRARAPYLGDDVGLAQAFITLCVWGRESWPFTFTAWMPVTKRPMRA